MLLGLECFGFELGCCLLIVQIELASPRRDFMPVHSRILSKTSCACER